MRGDDGRYMHRAEMGRGTGTFEILTRKST
jgi:hypothetical protein